jgi:predicted RNase H-like HicB family nuclease
MREFYLPHPMTYTIELERETDGPWIAEVPGLSGVLSYGTSREQAVARVQALALRVIAERLENDEAPPDLLPLINSALIPPIVQNDDR